MNRYAVAFGTLLLSVTLVGCGETNPPPPPQSDPMANMPDEVKEAETKFKQAAEENAKKTAAPAPKAK